MSHGHQYGLTITEAVYSYNFVSPEDGHIVPETCRELKNRINKSIKIGASSWFSVRKEQGNYKFNCFTVHFNLQNLIYTN
jgi:hypothetical protein